MDFDAILARKSWKQVVGEVDFDAILALLAFTLMPFSSNQSLKNLFVLFVPWGDCWFSNQLFRNEDFNEPSARLDWIPLPQALKCLSNHWKRNDSPINTARSSQCRVHAIKIIHDLPVSCRNKDNLFLRFILSNVVN